jgi:hypothetical protein
VGGGYGRPGLSKISAHRAFFDGDFLAAFRTAFFAGFFAAVRFAAAFFAVVFFGAAAFLLDFGVPFSAFFTMEAATFPAFVLAADRPILSAVSTTTLFAIAAAPSMMASTT